MDKLFNGMLSCTYENDTEAAWDIYKTSPANKSYLMLKSRIKDRLISHIFQVDIKQVTNNSPYLENAYLVTKYVAAGHLMLNFGISTEGENILKKAMFLGKSYQVTGPVVAAARLLRSRAGFKGTRKEIVALDKTIEIYLEIYAAELEADGMRDNLNIDFRESFSPQKKEKITKYWKRINYLNEKFDNYTLKINRARIGAKYFETIGEFRQIITICDEIVNFLLKNPKFKDTPRMREFSLIKVEASLFLKDYELGKQNAETCMNLFGTGINTVIVMEYYLLLCLHTGNYKKGWELFEVALTYPSFDDYPQERKEKWKLFEAYLYFVYPDRKRKFKLFKFLNEVTVYSRDKRGLNISIMIAQIVLLLDEGNFDILLDKAEAFKIYFKRYVTKHINYRTFYFVKMLETMFKYNFNYEKTNEVSSKFFMF
ncbi:hypothetical protein MEO93_27750 [Dolichospermum sp. ST_sed3]|nr:hypothetical protein [Dolichospermum sp. ST_sed3]